MQQPHENSVPQAALKIVPPNGGETTSIFGDWSRILLTCEDTAGQFIACDREAPSGSESPLHVHSREDEIHFVQSGCYEFSLDGDSIEVGPGTVVYCPRNVPHSFRMVGPEPGRALTFIWPGGCEHYFRRCASEFATGAPDFRKIVQIGGEFGIALLTPEGIEAHRAMRTASHKPQVISPLEGELWESHGTRIRVLLSAHQTGGDCTLVEITTPSNSGVTLPPRSHQREVFWIQKGRYEFQTREQCVEAEAGTLIYAPVDTINAIRVIGPERGQLVAAIFCSGMETPFFYNLSAPIGNPL
ncbi:hypothetical protein IAD21_05271 [Abditibacteriota bacterium]|nr:hypothetical protein IAD21_05271 [Abditibacteriota bacterium]